MRWIVYLLGLCLIVGGLGVIGLSIDLQGIERGTTLAISGTVALVGGVVTLALGAVIGKIESLSAALAPLPAIPPLNLPAQPLEPEPHAAPAPIAAAHDEARPGPSAGSIGGAAGAAALAASAYAYREMQSDHDRREAEPPPVEAPSLRPGFAPEISLAPEAPQDLAPAVSLKPLELAEERAETAPENEFDGEAPAADREALMEAAIRRDEADAAIAADIDAAPQEPAAPPDETLAPDHDDAAPEAYAADISARIEPDVADATAPHSAAEIVDSDESDPVNQAPAAAPEEASPVAEAGEAEPAEAPHQANIVEPAPHDAAADPLAWLDRALSDPPAPPEPPAAPPPPPPKPAPTVVGRYTSGGVNYTMYSDQSIDAETPTETLRFASMRELKAFIERRASGEA